MTQPQDASEFTRQANAKLLSELPADSGEDFTLANKGFIATIPDARVENAQGNAVWDMQKFDFCKPGTQCPDTVNPSLWRQAQLNSLHGLFKVCECIYQVRNFDLSNITFIEGDSGYLIIDPLISSEPAAAALALMRKHRGNKPVTGIIYTHSHVDHYGGINGVINDQDLANDLKIIAPEGFLEAAVSENMLAGNAMGRRATYMYGSLLPAGPRGHIDAGLGKTVSLGKSSLVPPTVSICNTGETLIIDGIEIIFQVTPDTEAPAEMNFYFPKFNALCMAENCSCHMHNIYTPRGAQVRDANAWSYYINEAIELYADKTDVLFASHHWPRWGTSAVTGFLSKQRDLYKYIHDQTLRMANHGLTATEIAEQLTLPPTLASEWYTRGYYGTLNHNAKAVYQRYLGWFDGNPANLHKLPPEDAGRKYVDALGGADALIQKAQLAYDAGDYRWVAELVNHLVFADPNNESARVLQANALEQLGYQAESGPWRGFYLSAAAELRNPIPESDIPRPGSMEALRGLPAQEILSALAVRLNGPKAGARTLSLNLHITDTHEKFLVTLENAVLNHQAGHTKKEVDASVHTTRLALADLGLKIRTLQTLLSTGEISLSGNESALTDLVNLLDEFDFWFQIVLP